MQNDTYGEPEIIKKGNIVARVYSPILTEKERDRRMELVKKAAVSLVLSKKTPLTGTTNTDSCNN